MGWNYRGIEGWGERPELCGTEGGIALILGGAACVWDDLRKVEEPVDSIIAVNDVGIYYRHPIRHWISYHEYFLPAMRHVRADRGRNLPILHGQRLENEKESNITNNVYYWPLTCHYSTSGILAVQVALLLGYDRVILAGMPADEQPDFWQDTVAWNTQGTTVRHNLWKHFINDVSDVKKCVRSVSGSTRDWFGSP